MATRSVVPIRLSVLERDTIDAAAKRLGQTRSTFIRRAALAACIDHSLAGRPEGRRSRPTPYHH